MWIWWISKVIGAANLSFLEAVGRSDRFLRAEGSEVQRKLFMAVRLRVLPAQSGQITDGGRNLSELFYAFFFFLLASLLRLSISGLWQVRMAAAAAGSSVPLHCVGCAKAGDKDVTSTTAFWQDVSGGEGNKLFESRSGRRAANLSSSHDSLPLPSTELERCWQ